MSKNSRTVRMPREFESFLDNLSEQISRDTGYAKNKSAAMRQLAKLNGKLVYQNGKWDWRLF